MGPSHLTKHCFVHGLYFAFSLGFLVFIEGIYVHITAGVISGGFRGQLLGDELKGLLLLQVVHSSTTASIICHYILITQWCS